MRTRSHFWKNNDSKFSIFFPKNRYSVIASNQAVHIVKCRKIEKTLKNLKNSRKKGVFDPKTGKFNFSVVIVFFFRNGTVSSPLNPMLINQQNNVNTVTEQALSEKFREHSYTLFEYAIRIRYSKSIFDPVTMFQF